MPSPEPPLLPGLELLRPIGRGSFGEVWLARTVTGQYRAVKLVPLGAEGSGLQALGERVFRGVQAYLDHLPPGSPAALAVLHVDRDPAGRFLYYVMELADDVTGGRAFAPEHYQALTLSELRRRAPGQWVPAPETIRLGRQLAEGLATLHAAGLVHRDIKPNNVVFIGGEPRLADIDLVRPAEASLSLGGAQGYSPLEGPGRPTADVFSLGRTLYATVTGLPVGEFPRLPEDWDQRPDAADLQRLNAVLLRTCDPDPARRHQTGAELAEDFRCLEQGEDVELDRSNRNRTRHITGVAATLLGVLVLAAIATFPALTAARNERTFNLYRRDLAQIRHHLDGGAFTNALPILTECQREHPFTFELNTLRTMVDSIRCASSTSATRSNITPSGGLYVGNPLNQLFISKAARVLNVVVGTNATLLRLSDGKEICTLTNVSRIAGFLSSGLYVAGSQWAHDGSTPLRVWSSESGLPLSPLLPGYWFPTGTVEDENAITALCNTGDERNLVRWNPFLHRVIYESVGDGCQSFDLTRSPQNTLIYGRRFLEFTEGLTSQSGNQLVCVEKYYKIGRQWHGDLSEHEYLYGTNYYLQTNITSERALYAIDDSLGSSPSWQMRESFGGFIDESNKQRFSFSKDGRTMSEIIASAVVVSRMSNHWQHQVTIKGNDIVSAALSPNGLVIALGGRSGRVRVVDAVTGQTVHRLFGGPIDPDRAPVDPFNNIGTGSLLSWSEDGALLAVGYKGHGHSFESLLEVWSLSNQPQAKCYRMVGADASHDGKNITISDDGEYVMVPLLGRRFSVAIVDSETLGERTREVYIPISGDRDDSDGHGGNINQPLNLRTDSNVMWMLGGSNSVFKCCVTRSLQSAMLGSESQPCKDEVQYQTVGFSRSVTNQSGVCSPNGRRFLLLGDDLLAVLACEGNKLRQIAEINQTSGVRFTDSVVSSDSCLAVALAADGSALLADLNTGTTRLLKQLNENVLSACFRPGSTQCYFGTAGGRLLRLDTATDDPPELLDANFGLPAHMIATPDGERLLTAGPGEQLGIRRLSDGAPIVQLTHHGLALEPGRHNLKRLLYLPKQQRVISLSEDGWLTQW